MGWEQSLGAEIQIDTGVLTAEDSKEFRVVTRDPHGEGLLPMEGSFAFTGVLSGEVFTLQVRIGGTWHDTELTFAAGTATSIAARAAGAPTANKYAKTSAWGERFRFHGDGGGDGATLGNFHVVSHLKIEIQD